MSRHKEYLEDLEETRRHGGHVIRSHRKPPTGNVRRMLAGAVVALISVITIVPSVDGTSVTNRAITAPVVDAEGLETLEPVTTTYELQRDTATTSRGASTPTVVVRAGDTYGGWARIHCGNFAMWPAIQAANGWPEHRIPTGATARIVCASYRAATTPPAAATTSAAWVHPLSSGKLGNSCYRSSNRPSHGGVDIAQPSGTPIRSVAAGTVYRKLYESGGAGYYVTIQHAGNVFSQYHHLRSHSPLALGSSVQAGQTIGYVGATGNADGYHLHLEIRSGGASAGNRVNPATFLRSRGINIGC